MTWRGSSFGVLMQMFVNTFEALAEFLENRGFSQRSFTVVREGNYSAKDAEWNYKDIRHAHYVHEYFDTKTVAAADEWSTAMVVQRFMGKFKIPLCLSNFQYRDNEVFYFTSTFCFALVIRTKFIPTR